MIRLCNVSLSLRGKGVGHGPIIRDVSVALPTNRRMAILGGSPRALTEVLSMLAGLRTPDRGWIDREQTRCSPVVNASSVAGRTLVFQLSALDNIRLAAATHGVDEATLIALVESACQLGKMLTVPVNDLGHPVRRKLEATLIAAIPFDCYYIDNLHEFEGPIIWQFVHVAYQRGAGIFFTSRRPNQVRNFAQLGATIRNGSLEVREDLAHAPAGEVT
jgi:capsular polysaccharide transport system ATP-binding protein